MTLKKSMMGRYKVYRSPKMASRLMSSWKPASRKLNVLIWSVRNPQKIMVWRRPAYQYGLRLSLRVPST